MISDYPESDFLNKAIFEASELLGQLDQSDQQMALLESLSESKGIWRKSGEKLHPVQLTSFFISSVAGSMLEIK